jgi:hypothetical protein
MTAYLDLGDLNPYAVELRYGLEDDQDSHLDRHPLRNACTRGASIRVQVRGQHAPSRGVCACLGVLTEHEEPHVGLKKSASGSGDRPESHRGIGLFQHRQHPAPAPSPHREESVSAELFMHNLMRNNIVFKQVIVSP